MKMCKLRIEGHLQLSNLPFEDSRGKFLNLYRSDESEYKKAWGEKPIKQINICRTKEIGTVRGLHLQKEPYSEAKLVRCLSGKIWDVCVDIRPLSKTFGQWDAVELTAEASNTVLIPEGCAHGYQVLEAESELLYIHSGPWVKEAESGVRFDDPELAIEWPLAPQGISERDLNLPVLESIV